MKYVWEENGKKTKYALTKGREIVYNEEKPAAAQETGKLQFDRRSLGWGHEPHYEAIRFNIPWE